MTYKNIRIPKRGGGTRLQRVQVLRSGKYKFVKNPSKSRASKPKTKTKRKRSGRKTARKKKKEKKRRVFTLPLGLIGPMAAIPFVPSKDGWASPFNDAKAGRWTSVGAHLVNGFNPFYEINNPVTFAGKFGFHVPRYLALIVGGFVTHKVASWLGVNRALGRAGVPIVRV